MLIDIYSHADQSQLLCQVLYRFCTHFCQRLCLNIGSHFNELDLEPIKSNLQTVLACINRKSFPWFKN